MESKSTDVIKNKPPLPPLDYSTLSSNEKGWLKKNLTEQLEQLIESMGHSISELNDMKEAFELNIPKRNFLEKTIVDTDKEIYKIKSQLTELNKYT